jgi:polyhydroxybutyrate depolymerase
MTAGVLVRLALSLVSAHMLGTGDHARELRVGEEVRSYLVHVPPSYQPGKPAPVVLVFHSAMMNGASMAKFCGLNEKADQAGFVAVYANGTGSTPYLRYWDAGGVRGRVSDDVGYVAKLLDDLETVVTVDPRRVFATGMSNGAMMCYRLAAELSDRIAAIAPVAGTMAVDRCQPSRPVPVLHFHGTKDGLVLYGGPDERTPPNIKFLSVEDSIRAWVNANGCPGTPREDIRLDVLAADGTAVRRIAYGPGKDGSEVILYSIEGGGHTWPGRDPRLRLLGKSTRQISANDLMWEFFQRHPRDLEGRADSPACR